MLLSDPRYRWGPEKLQGSESVCSQKRIKKKKKETIINDKCFLLFPVTLPVPLHTPIGNTAATGPAPMC